MTSLIGNYGVNPDDFESDRPYVAGFVVREYCPYPSNFRATGTLGDFLARYNIIGIEGIDTRQLVRTLRVKGAMRGVLSTIDLDAESLVAKAKAVPPMIGADLASEVTCAEPYYVIETPQSAARQWHSRYQGFSCGNRTVSREDFLSRRSRVLWHSITVSSKYLRKLAGERHENHGGAARRALGCARPEPGWLVPFQRSGDPEVVTMPSRRSAG